MAIRVTWLGGRRAATPPAGLRRSARGAFAAALWLAAGCSPPPPKVAVEIRIAADAARRQPIEVALRADPGAPLELRFADLPASSTSPTPDGAIERAIAAARKRYVDADVRRCLEGLAQDADLIPLFLDGRRATIGRVLFWRVACHVMANEAEDAAREAHLFASLGLEVPAESGAASPEVESVLGKALKDVAASPTAQLRVTTTVPGASVSIDGRAAACVTPCTLELYAGAHFIGVYGDGIAPEVRRVTMPSDKTIAFAPVPAAPEVAARQWAARYAGTERADSAPSLRLLAQAARARKLSLFVLNDAESPARLRGALTVDGVVRARAERPLADGADPGREARSILRELLVEGKVIESRSIVKNPLFWIAIAGVAGAAVGITYAATHRPAATTEIRF